MVTFTGSVDVGLRIRNLAGMKRVTLELGSNSAVIVEDDADLAEAVPALRGRQLRALRPGLHLGAAHLRECQNSRRVCRPLRRNGARKLRIGHPHSPDTDVSSLITEGEAKRVESWIGEAVEAGAKLVTGGARTRSTIEPAVLTDVPAERENRLPRGFRSGGRDQFLRVARRGHRPGQRFRLRPAGRHLHARYPQGLRRRPPRHVGGFMINEIPQYRVDQMPYGGVKMSGTGREGPKYAIEEMTEPKLICWKE